MMRGKKIHWQYYFARKFSLQRFEVVARVFFSDFYKDDFGVRIPNIMIKPEGGGNHAIWLDAKEYQQCIKKIFAVVCRDLKSFYYYKRMIQRVQKAWLKVARRVGINVRPDLSLNQLAKLYDIFIYHHQEHFNKPIWIPFPIEPLVSGEAERALVTVLWRAEKSSEYDKWFQIVFSPEEKNAITRAHEALLRLALDIKQKRLGRKRIDTSIDQITSRFCFIPCYDVIDTPWDETHFRKELNMQLRKSVPELHREYTAATRGFALRPKLFRNFLRTFPMKKREREILTMAHEMVFIKDERDDYRRMGSYAARPLFGEIGRRVRLTDKEAAYLSIEETKNFLHRDILPPPPSVIRERVRGYLLLWKRGNPPVVATGREIKHILVTELPPTVHTKVSEVRGVIGSPGKASGRVAIVRTKHDLRRISSGAIMVAVTTNPDFVPAMRLCRAIVTDEGGITAHAAIVSRELHIPCIVGTKIGTKTFRDGDRVEVDAVKGTVLRLP